MCRFLALRGLCAVAALFSVSRGNAATLTAFAVAVNEQPIAPTASVTISPRDSVTCEFYLGEWDADLPGGTLRAYQVTIDGAAGYASGTAGRIEPLGWDALWPASCAESSECPESTPECLDVGGHCGCVADASCPFDYPTCSHGLCVGANHNGSQATYVDVDRPDFAHFGQDPFAAAQVANSSLSIGWGSVVLTGDGPLDTGNQVYVGTHVVRATENACGTFTLLVDPSDHATFEILYGPSGPSLEVLTTLTYEPLTIDVETGEACVPLIALQSFAPRSPWSVSRTHRNTISLVFDKPITAPVAGQVTIMELTDDVCAGLAGPDLFGQFEYSVINDQVSRPRLRIVDPVIGTLQHARWYRIASTDGWVGVEPFQVDVRVLIGDVNGDGFVSFADFGAINSSIPTLRSGINDSNRRKDVNADGFINFADMGTVSHYNPTFQVPHPCP